MPSDESDDRVGRKPARAAVLGATEVYTSDPNIVAPAAPPPPERNVTFETSSLPGPTSPYPFPSDTGAGNDKNRGDKPNGHEGKRRGGQEKDKHGADYGEGNKDCDGYKSEQAQSEEKDHTKRGDGGTQEQADQRKQRTDDRQHRHETGEQPDLGDRKNDDRRLHRERGRKKKKSEDLRSKLPTWSTVLISAVLALLCGVGGAWGYSTLFASDSAKKEDSSGKGSGKSAGSDSSDQLKDLKKNLGDVDDGIKQLTARLDRVAELLLESRLPVPEYYSGTSRIARMAPPPSDESPPILPNALPTKLNVLERKVDQMADIPDRLRALEERVLVLQEEIKMLTARQGRP